jgi:predicted nucleotidyltransferase
VEGRIATSLESSREAIRALLEDAGVVLAYVFGSAAHGTERVDSDLDLAILLGRKVPRELHGEIRLRLLTELVGLTHVNDIDLVVLNDAPPLLAHQVITTGRLILGTRSGQVHFEVEAIKRYIDTRRLRDHLAQALERRLREGAPAGHEPPRPW